jgi:hypothetical protein
MYDRRDAVHKKTVAGPGTAPHKSRLLAKCADCGAGPLAWGRPAGVPTHPSDERPHTGIDARPASQVSRRKPVGAFRNSPQSSHVIVPARRHDVRPPCKAFFQSDINPARRRFGTAQAKPTGSFHSGGLIGRDARTTSAQGRACSAAPVDSGGASWRL